MLDMIFAEQLSTAKCSDPNPFLCEKGLKDARAFQEEVLLHAPPSVSRPLLGLVSQFFIGQGACARDNVTLCIQLAAWLHRASIEDLQASVHRQPVEARGAARPTPEMRLRSARLRHQVTAWVEAVRTALFGPATPPFPSLAEAIAWLEREVRGLYEGIEPRARALYVPLWGQALGAAPPTDVPGGGAPSRRLAALLEAVRAATIMVLAPADPRGPRGLIPADAARPPRPGGRGRLWGESGVEHANNVGGGGPMPVMRALGGPSTQRHKARPVHRFR
jgi:hypothetical protein